MSWLQRDRKGLKTQVKQTRKEIPDGLWMKCPSCAEILFRQELEKNLWVCSKCQNHFRVGADVYLDFLLDEGTFRETHRGITSLDPLQFKVAGDRYVDKLRQAESKTQLEDAVVTSFGDVNAQPVTVAVMDFRFMGGSMGSVVGEKIGRAIRDSIETRRPLIIVSQSGGARMQESILSLMQMAKTSALLGKLRKRGVPFISILTHPTTGGVTASFAMLGDLILAEPRALIGFAGPRVIQQTINAELPEGFQTAEFLEQHGQVDRVVGRHELRRILSQSLRFFTVERRAGQRPVHRDEAEEASPGPRLLRRAGGGDVVHDDSA